MNKPKASIILGNGNQDRIYPSGVRSAIGTLCDVVAERIPPDAMSSIRGPLRETRLLFTGWGAPRLDDATLAMMPSLEAVFYGAGSIKAMVTEAFWEKDIPVCSAWAANAIPVAEFAFAHIILALKQALRFPALLRDARRPVWPLGFSAAGTFGNAVGLVSLGEIGRRVAGMLRTLDVRVYAFDPLFSDDAAAELGVELIPLEEVFSRCRVVSLHTPWLKETEGMITGALLARMPLGATFINTARGAVVRESELVEVLKARPDLTAILDVVHPEPAPPDSPLYDLPNVFLTPHIAGSVGAECGRMGAYMVEECRRFLSGEPLRWRVTREAAARMA